MAFLAPAAAVSSTAGAAALAKGATMAAGSGLASGIAAGTALGSGASMLSMPALSYAGSNLALPALASKGLAAAPGIFSAATPALAGLPSAVAPTAGIFAKATPAIAGLPSAATPALSKSLMMANAPLTTPSSFSAINQAVGLGDVGTKAANLAPTMTKTAGTVTEQLAGRVPPVDIAGEAAKWQQYAANAGYTTPGGPAAQITREMVPGGITKGGSAFENLGNLIQNPSFKNVKDYAEEHPYATSAAVGLGTQALMGGLGGSKKAPEQDKGSIRPYEYTRTQRPEAYAVSPLEDTSERMYFDSKFTPLPIYSATSEKAKEIEKIAEGGIAKAYAVGGPIETMAAMNAVGANTGYPMAAINTPMYANPMMQRPEAVNVLSPSGDAGVGAYSGEPKFAEGGELKTVGEYKYSFDPKTNTFTQLSTPRYAEQPVVAQMGQTPVAPVRPPLETGSKTAGGIAAPVGGFGTTPSIPLAQQAYAGPTIPAYQSPEQQLGLTDFYAMMNRRLSEMSGYAEGGGVSHLGDYSDGGRLLKGPGDGVSDSIPAVIGKRQPARLADGEFVVPARIVSELGNGSTEAGARKLYAMMDRIQKGRRKSVGKGKVAVDSKSDKHLPA